MYDEGKVGTGSPVLAVSASIYHYNPYKACIPSISDAWIRQASYEGFKEKRSSLLRPRYTLDKTRLDQKRVINCGQLGAHSREYATEENIHDRQKLTKTG